MTEIKNILCPVDYSAPSRAALEHAVQLAKWFGSSLTILHVYTAPAPPPPVLYGGVPGPMPVPSVPPLSVSPEEAHKAAAAELMTFAAGVDTATLSVKFQVRPGSPARDILDEAAALGCDLIVMGTHGRGGFDRWILGSVAEKVLRKATCTVLTVPPVAARPADALGLFKRILCPLDFSDASLKALEHALSFAKEADAQLLLVHVIEGLPESANWKMSSTPAIVEYLRLYERDALARLRDVLPEDARTWCQPEVLLVTGKPHVEILRLARERDVHLIVMGVHGRNAVDRLFFGSTTSQIVRAASCPVLTRKV